MFKSTDGGDTWTEIKNNRGLPSGVLGKVGVTVSPLNANRVWAMIEAKDGGLYRSDDGGENWQSFDSDRELCSVRGITPRLRRHAERRHGLCFERAVS